MQINKDPSPNNISVEFNQHCCELIKDDSMYLFTNFHNCTLDVQILNYGVIRYFPNLLMLIKFSNLDLFAC
jgi:hypothetical protein